MKNTFEIKVFGNIYNNKFKGTNFGGYVYDKYYLAPCLNAMQGGGRQPMIIVRREDISNE